MLYKMKGAVVQGCPEVKVTDLETFPLNLDEQGWCHYGFLQLVSQAIISGKLSQDDKPSFHKLGYFSGARGGAVHFLPTVPYSGSKSCLLSSDEW